MVTVVYTAIAFTLLLSIAAFFISIYCFIKIKATELSRYEFIQTGTDDMFETDMSKINEQLEDESFDEEVTSTFEPDKPFNEVIL